MCRQTMRLTDKQTDILEDRRRDRDRKADIQEAD